MTTITQWIEQNIEWAEKAIELNEVVGGDWQYAELERHRLTVLKEQLEQERQKHEPDWQAEALEWRRGIGGFVEWLLMKIDQADYTRAMLVQVYQQLQMKCPQAQINWNAPPPTPEEIAEINQIMRDEGLIE